MSSRGWRLILPLGTRQKTRNIAVYLGLALLFAVVLPDGLTKGNKYVGGRDTFLAVCVLCGGCFVVWLVATDRVWKRLPHRRAASHGITAAIQTTSQRMVLEIQVEGPSMRDAGVTLTAPNTCAPLVRIGRDGSPKGDRDTVFERLSRDGNPLPALRWHEKGLHLLGGGHTSRFAFIASPPPGDYPMRLRVYDDSGAMVRDSEIFLTAGFSTPTPDPGQRRNQLQIHRNFLDENRAAIVLALGRGYYWDWSTSLRRGRSPIQSPSWPLLDQTGKDARICELLEQAYGECDRLEEIADSKGTNERPLRDADGAERALMAVLHASLLINLTLSREAAA